MIRSLAAGAYAARTPLCKVRHRGENKYDVANATIGTYVPNYLSGILNFATLFPTDI